MKQGFGTAFIFILIYLNSVRSRYLDESTEHYHPDSKSMRHENKNRNINWNKMAQEDISSSLYNIPQYGTAKNVILFLGDGMGLSDVTSTRFLLAERLKKNVEDVHLSFDKFPFHGFSKTHTSDRMTADSAGAATAILCGEKVNFYTVGVKDSVPLYDCTNVNEQTKLKSLLVHSMEKGKWTGIVTNTRITHATPSAAYAHTADRNGEAVLPKDTIKRDSCQDIAYQLVHGDGKDIRVIMGGGRKNMISENMTDIDGTPGRRKDGRNLIDEWRELKTKSGLQYRVPIDKEELDKVPPDETDYLLGLFASDHMSYDHDRRNQKPIKEPSLSEMVKKAIQILQRNTKQGYFLFVEGGRIDQAHHKNLAYKALDETIQFSEAVKVAMDMTKQEETLIVVTADHSHVFNLAGYPDIDSPVLGTYMSAWEPRDRMPFTPLTYANGPGFDAHRMNNGTVTQRRNITGEDTAGPDYVFDAGIPIDDETHGGEDVGIHARGPMSYMFQGIHQQHYIAHAIMYASCVGPHQTVCDNPPVFTTAKPTNNAHRLNLFKVYLVILVSLFGGVYFKWI